MKLKQIKLEKSNSFLSDEEMRFVIGRGGLDPIPEGGTCYVGKCEGEYTYMDPDGTGFRLMCYTPYTDCE